MTYIPMGLGVFLYLGGANGLVQRYVLIVALEAVQSNRGASVPRRREQNCRCRDWERLEHPWAGHRRPFAHCPRRPLA